MKIHPLLLVTVAVFCLLDSGIANEKAPISPETLKAKLDQGNALLIDVREPPEFESGVLKEALLLPMSDLRGDRDQWDPVLENASDKTLILYCRTGNRSGQVAATLEQEGYSTLNLGGFFELKEKGFPTRIPDQKTP